MSRLYSNIWNELKKNNTCSVAAHPLLHRRIIKAVRKEKDIDIGFKLIKSEELQRARMHYRCESSRITFWLKYHFDFSCVIKSNHL